MKTGNRKGKHKMLIVIFVILGIIVIVLAGTMLALEPGRREAMNLVIDRVDFKNLQDGTYVGEYKGNKDSIRNTTVQVTVALGAVTEIKVKKGALANEKQTAEVRNGVSINDLLNKVIGSQSLQVDVISGATISSKVHLKAVENALEQAAVK